MLTTYWHLFLIWGLFSSSPLLVYLLILFWGICRFSNLSCQMCRLLSSSTCYLLTQLLILFALQKSLCTHMFTWVCACMFMSSHAQAKCAWRSEADIKCCPVSFSSSFPVPGSHWTRGTSVWLCCWPMSSKDPPVSACAVLGSQTRAFIVSLPYMHARDPTLARKASFWWAPSPQKLHRNTWISWGPICYFLNTWVLHRQALAYGQFLNSAHTSVKSSHFQNCRSYVKESDPFGIVWSER